MKLRLILATGAILTGLGSAGTSQAASISYSFSSTFDSHGSPPQQEISLFQGSDLDAVLIDWTASAGADYVYDSMDPFPSTEYFDGYAGFQLSVESAYPYSTSAGDYFSGSTTACGYECSPSGTVSGSFYIPTADLDSFVGNGEMLVDADGYVEGVYPGLYLPDGDGFVSALGSVTYFFGAIPEPATWAMMLVGFGVIGCAARRRLSVTVAYSG